MEARREPKVPACQPCNQVKSSLEHYLPTVSPFADRHADAPANLQDMVPRRLAKNRRLHRTLAAWIREAGAYMPTSTLPFEPEKLEELFDSLQRARSWFR